MILRVSSSLGLELLKVLQEAVDDVRLCLLIDEAGLSDVLEARRRVSNQAVDVGLQVLLGVDWLDILTSTLHVSKQLLELNNQSQNSSSFTQHMIAQLCTH